MHQALVILFIKVGEKINEFHRVILVFLLMPPVEGEQ
jgi:hypothetical protein